MQLARTKRQLQYYDRGGYHDAPAPECRWLERSAISIHVRAHGHRARCCASLTRPVETPVCIGPKLWPRSQRNFAFAGSLIEDTYTEAVRAHPMLETLRMSRFTYTKQPLPPPETRHGRLSADVCKQIITCGPRFWLAGAIPPTNKRACSTGSTGTAPVHVVPMLFVRSNEMFPVTTMDPDRRTPAASFMLAFIIAMSSASHNSLSPHSLSIDYSPIRLHGSVCAQPRTAGSPMTGDLVLIGPRIDPPVLATLWLISAAGKLNRVSQWLIQLYWFTMHRKMCVFLILRVGCKYIYSSCSLYK